MTFPNQLQYVSADLHSDDAAGLVAEGLAGVMLVERPQRGVELVDEGRQRDSLEVEAQVVQQELHLDASTMGVGVHRRGPAQEQRCCV